MARYPWTRLSRFNECFGRNTEPEAIVRRQLFFLINDSYFSPFCLINIQQPSGLWEKWESSAVCWISKLGGKVLVFGLFHRASFSIALRPPQFLVQNVASASPPISTNFRLTAS